jgi:hypothetical protein
MLGRSAHLILFLGAAVLSLAPSTRANGQCRLCGAPTTVRDEESAKGEVRLEVETSLSFDRLIVLGQGEGSAVVRPDGSTSNGGTMAEVSPRAMAGTVTVHGEPGRAIRIDLPRRILLHSLSGGEVSFDDVTSDLPSMPRLDAAGNLTFRFGGRLKVSGDADGDYRGDLPITAEYL